MIRNYRDNGAIGALLDEYEKAIDEFIVLVSPITETELSTIVDYETKDEDTRSIQTILTHVVRAGYYYCVATRSQLGELVQMREIPLYQNTKDFILAVREMFQYNVEMFETISNGQIEEKQEEKKIHVRWGQTYDIEQLYEHAIVHILRHRRQIERYLIRLRN